MKLTSLDGLVVILVVWLAYLLGRNKRPADNYEDFCLARRSLNDWNFLAAFFGANLVFTAVFIIISHEAARRGWWALSIPIAFVCGVLVLAGIYKRLEPDFASGITLHGAFERAFASPDLRKWCAVWTIVAFVGLVSIEFYGAILLLQWIGLPFLWPVTIGILLAAVCIAFTMSGGLRGVTRADVCLDVASLIGVALFIYALHSSPPSVPLAASLPTHPILPPPTLNENILFTVAAFLIFTPMPICALDTWQRGVAWKRTGSSVKPFLTIGAVAIGSVSCVAIYAGFFAIKHGWLPTTIGSDTFRFVLAELHVESWWPLLRGLIVAGFLAAVLSTADELLNCSAYSILSDCFRLSPEGDEEAKARGIQSVKFYTAAFGLVAVLLAVGYGLLEQYGLLGVPDIFNVVGGAQVVFFIPLLIAIFSKNSKKFAKTAKWSMILSFVVALLCAIIGALSNGSKEGRELLEAAPIYAFITSLIVWAASWFRSSIRRKPSELASI